MRSKFGEALNNYEGTRPAGMGWLSFQFIVKMLTNAARKYLTAWKSHVVLNIFARVARAFLRFYRAFPHDSKAADRK
jgi:hypothetical protein